MFGVMLSALVALMHWYIWKRLVKDTMRRGRARRVLTVLVVVLAMLVFATLTLPRLIGVAASGWFAWPGYIWFGLVVYLFLTLLVLELPRLALRPWTRRTPLEATATAPVPPGASPPAETTPAAESPQPAEAAAPARSAGQGVSRRLFLARSTGLVASTAAVSLTGVGMANALGPPDLLRVPVRLPNLDPAFDGFRIAVVSDIHLGPLSGRAHSERIVRMINETSPDMVAIVGDLADGSVDELGPAAEPLRDLVSREGTFFVTGNHEYFEEPFVWLRELDRLGLHSLRNENTVIRRGGAAFDLAGVNDISGRLVDDGPDFDKALAGRDSSRPTVLLAHQPVQVSEAAKRGVALQLSGHTHGGQLWPFHYIVDAQQGAVAGLSTVDGTQLYVTRGAGFWGPPVRVGAPPDITVLSLRS
ncbi:metallophosphoesterase [Actinophytocola glycyrrhizae]|uniref:Metallophosphoesterase n=1 Tax=Actinophytocola glycyrrhizae TaxID=2044873 RepID=A0ABV9SH66_9PSEU